MGKRLISLILLVVVLTMSFCQTVSKSDQEGGLSEAGMNTSHVGSASRLSLPSIGGGPSDAFNTAISASILFEVISFFSF